MRTSALLLVAGCAAGPPPVFGHGDPWEISLVDPLADGALIGAGLSARQPSTLFALDLVYAGFHQVGSEVARGRKLTQYGLPTDRYIFGVDRDAGVAWGATPAKAHELIPTDAQTFPIWGHGSRQRYGVMVTAQIGGESHDLELNFYEPRSKLRSPPPGPREVTLGRITRSVTFVRTGETIATEADGVLGLDFFHDFNVAIDMTSGAAGDLYVWPRHPVAPDKRIARWGSGCAHATCAELELRERRLEVRPDRVPLQLVVHATSQQGAALPALEINADDGAKPFAVELDPQYADAQLEVVDASPFPRLCAGAPECVVPY